MGSRDRFLMIFGSMCIRLGASGLFQEVFVGGISSGDGSNGMMGGGAIPSPADGMVQGAYHSV